MDNVGIIAAGGPAPGINGVISSATIEARNRGRKVIGILDGFKWISRGDTSKVLNLDIQNTSRIHTTGGSIIGISRQNPLATDETFRNTISSIEKLEIGNLITIGGDGTMFLAKTLHEHFKGKVKIAHLPKTIDNNIVLPDYIATFGFETARDVGAKIMNNIMEEAKTTGRWFLVITMGRRTGHLALGIGQSVGATITIIPEDFEEKRVPLEKIVAILEGSIIKRMSMGREYGVAILAEGILDMIDPVDLGLMDKDSLGRIKYADVNFGQLLKNTLSEKLYEKGVEAELVHKRLGYEMRSANPIPFDVDYTRKLGYCAVKYLLSGEGDGALVYVRRGKIQATPFQELLDKKTNSIKVRYMDKTTEAYEVAQKYMIKLVRNDLETPAILEKLSRQTSLSSNEFREYFAKIFH
ncbi:MAG: 6-phosphofructokinase [Candidatus Dadabacteria bacterium]|nr:6-phosphofructokinase [Candidatus Dadabacteria bacterium]